MDDLSVIDSFLATFSTFIDSGFGLLGGEVRYLTTALIVIDITLAGLFWAFSENGNIIPQFIKKVLYVGFFAYIIGNFAFLSGVIFDSFSGLGIAAVDSGFTASDLMRPGFVANTGFQAAQPLLAEVDALSGPVGFFVNFVTIMIMLASWLLIMVSFFILAIQLFVTILEFKLTTLAGFVLVPFALWNKTSFLAEKVLGNIVSAGIKLMVLAIIVGIGSTLFTGFGANLGSGDVTMTQALSVALGALSLLGLGMFGPGIATGLITGAPQLGAGSAVATGAAGAAVAGGAALGTLRGSQAAASGVSSAVKAGASIAGGTKTAFQLGSAASGKSGVAGAAAGLKSVAQAGGDATKSAAAKPFKSAGAAIGGSYTQGSAAAFSATGGSSSKGSVARTASIPTKVANDAGTGSSTAGQGIRDAESAASHGARGGGGSGSSTVSLRPDEEDQ